MPGKKKSILLKYKWQIALCYLVLPFNFTIAQVCGISGAKLCVPDAGAIDAGTFEFEPSYYVLN
jgi:hypothetical protein